MPPNILIVMTDHQGYITDGLAPWGPGIAFE